MPTIAEIIDIYPKAQYLATKDIQKRGLDGGGVDVTLPQKIYNIGKSVQRIYDDDPTDTTLTQTANFLYALCGKYGLQAQVISQNAGHIAAITTTSSLPLPLDFIISGSSIIATGETSKTFTSFIGYNLSFDRGGQPQYTTDPGDGSTYFSWNRTTGEFALLNGAAQVDERFRITPIG